jgi:outer membrane immunogenic protein
MRLALYGAALTALFATSSAMAADMPVKAPVYKAPPVMFSWTGWYIGGFVGGAWSDRDVTTTDPCAIGTICTTTGNYNGVAPISYKLDSSFIGGYTSGYNWQTGAMVFGLESETGYMRMRGSRQFVNAAGVPVAGTSGDTSAVTKYGDWYSIIAGRLGFVWGERALVYAKGGAFVTRISNGVVDSCTTAVLCGGGLINTTHRDTEWSWTAGGGIEYAFSPAWSAKVEYMYLDTRDDRRHCGLVGPGNTTTDCSVSSDPGVHTVKFGLNYHWGAAPVVARY